MFRKLIDSDYFLPVLFLAFLLIAGTSQWNRPYDEIGDEALIGLQTIRAGHLAEGVGPYSRAGFHHPGPINFYLYAAAETVFPFIKAPGQRFCSVSYQYSTAALVFQPSETSAS
jgi:hypothetical protein